MFQLPVSGQEAEVRRMSGHEEDGLTNEKKLRSGEAFEDILVNCTVALDGERPTASDIRKLKSPDRLKLLIEIRRESLGDIVPLEGTCACKKLSLAEVDLTELKDRPYDPDKSKECIIAGRRVVFDYMDGNDEMKLLKVKEDVITYSMLLRIKEVEGVHPNGVKAWLKDIGMADRQELRRMMEETDCGPQTAVTMDCDDCGREITVRVEAQTGFFFPKK